MFGPEERSSALAVWATVAGAGIALGPVAGGLLVPLAGWPSVFVVNVPFVLIALIAGRVLLPESTRPGRPPLDLAGAGLSAVALAGIVFALIEGAHLGWMSAEVLAAAAVGALAGWAFVARERRVRSPLFDIRVLARRPVNAGTAAILAVYVAFVGVLFLLPQYPQYVRDRPVLVCGLLLARSVSAA